MWVSSCELRITDEVAILLGVRSRFRFRHSVHAMQCRSYARVSTPRHGTEEARRAESWHYEGVFSSDFEWVREEDCKRERLQKRS
jgi:hypothetical protein